MNRRSLLALGSALLAGCSVLPTRENQQRRDWPLVPRRPSVAPPLRNGRVLLIRTTSAEPGRTKSGLLRERARRRE